MSYYTLVATQTGDPARMLSAALFNNSHLICVVNAIAAKGRQPFTTRQLANTTLLADSVVRQVIRRLVESGFLEATISQQPSRGRAPNYLRVTNIPGWSELKSLCRKLSR